MSSNLSVKISEDILYNILVRIYFYYMFPMFSLNISKLAMAVNEPQKVY